MKERLRSIPFLRYQLLTWVVWGIAMWLYVNKVVPEAFSGWRDWAVLMVLHVASANFTAFWCGPRARTCFRNGQMGKAAGYVGLLLLVVPVASILVSLALGAVAVRSYNADPSPEVVNAWQVLIVLYAGVIMGLVYYGALWTRHLMKLDGVRFAQLEGHLQRTLDNGMRERLNVQLIPHMLNNLMETLHYTVKWHPNKVQQVVYCIAEFTKTYSRYDGHSLIPLRDELDLVDLYLNVISIRLGYRANLEVDAPADVGGVGCIPMMLILLVENMKKYAELSDSAYPARIRIRIHKDRLLVTAENRKGGNQPDSSSKVGLENLAERLRLYWGDEASINVVGTEASAQDFCVRIACHTALFA